MNNILKHIPGFRSGKKYKMLIALIYYIANLALLSEGIGYTLFGFSIPFIIFSLIDILKSKKNSMSIKKSLIPLLLSLGIAIIGLSITPNSELTETEGQLVVENEDESNEDTTKATAASEGETLVNDSEEGESETSESEEEQDLEDNSNNLDNNDKDKIDNEDSESDSESGDKLQETSEESTEASQGSGKPSGKLEVHFIDVGQGDASLVISDGETMLIDGGNPGDSNLIYTYLKKHGIKHIDYLVNTHPHADHVGGLAGALNFATVGKAFSSETSYDSKAFESFVKYLNEQNLSISIPKAGDKFKLGGATVQVLSGRKKFNDTNNDSIVLKVTYGNTSFLFTGDAEREAEEALVNSGANLSSTVLHVGHHGSDTSTSYPFLREVMPKYAVISVGKNNSYGHPTEGVLSKLRDADAKVLRTDMQGDIIFTSDGSSVSFTTARNKDADTLGPVSKETKPSTTKQTQTQAPTESKVKQTVSPSPTETKEATQVVETTESTAPETSPPSSEKQVDPVDAKYILNVNTNKFHYPDCGSVKRMSEKNKKESNLTRDELVNKGYDPCGNCKP